MRTKTHSLSPTRIHPLSIPNFFPRPLFLRRHKRLMGLIPTSLTTTRRFSLTTNPKPKRNMAQRKTTRETRQVRSPKHHSCPHCRSSSPCTLTTPGQKMRSELICCCVSGIVSSLELFPARPSIVLIVSVLSIMFYISFPFAFSWSPLSWVAIQG